MDERHISDENLDEIVDEALRPFYKDRIRKVSRLRLRTILQSKNIYMFRAMGIRTIPDFIRAILSAYTSSSDESKFGRDFFEPIIRNVSKGEFTSKRGMDLLLITETEYIDMTIKSGPNWGNSDQWKQMDQRFIDAVSAYMTHRGGKKYVGVLGQCYGTVNRNPMSGHPYFVMSGQRFWSYLTGDSTFYRRLLRSVGRIADAYTHEYDEAFEGAINRLTAELSEEYTTADKMIDWDAIIQVNSGD